MGLVIAITMVLLKDVIKFEDSMKNINGECLTYKQYYCRIIWISQKTFKPEPPNMTQSLQ
jgi:hypothetical protein